MIVVFVSFISFTLEVFKTYLDVDRSYIRVMSLSFSVSFLLVFVIYVSLLLLTCDFARFVELFDALQPLTVDIERRLYLPSLEDESIRFFLIV